MRWTIILLVVLTILTLDVSGQAENKPANQEPMIDPIEQSASFPGGVDSLKKFVKTNLVQPADKKTGRVFVGFFINEDGTTGDFEVLRGLTKECDERALEVMKKMPTWIPGTQGGKPIRQRFVMPVIFE